MNTNDRVIVALDVGSEAQAKALVEQLGVSASSYKVGLQLLTAEGPSIIRWLVGQGKKVFLDFKLHEIPSSVTGTRPHRLTSMGDEDLADIGVSSGSVLEQVERLALLALAAGCHGVVASAQEATRLRQVLPAKMLIVTPGT